MFPELFDEMKKKSVDRPSESSLPPSEKDAQSPHYKAGRVKVAVRVRPPFQDEVDAHRKSSNGQQGKEFAPIVNMRNESNSVAGGGDNDIVVGKVQLKVSPGKHREFWFDNAFSATAGQDHIYDRVARPVVADVLRGFNGTIFAYGQTGTG